MNRQKLTFLILILLASCFFGCGNPPQIRFGLLAPESGEKQNLGKEITNGAQTFADEVNSRPTLLSGCGIGLIHYDFDNRPSQSVAYTKRLLDVDKVLGLITYIEDPSLLSLVAKECSDRNTTLISLSGAGWQLTDRNFIELGPDEATDWRRVVDVALVNNPNVPIAYINLTPKQVKHGEVLLKYLSERSLVPVWKNSGAFEPPDNIQTAVELHRLGVKLIFVDGSPSETDPIAYQLAIDHYRAVFVFLQAQDFPEKFITLDLSLFPDALFYCRFSPLQSELGARQFTSGYHGRTGRDPNSFVALGYDAMTILAKAWQINKQMDPASVKSNIASKSWQLATLSLAPGTPQVPPVPKVLTVKRDELDKPAIFIVPDEANERK